MSYILDALKKLEHEKNRKARGNGMSSITGELFNNDQQRGEGKGAGKIVLITFFVSLVTCGATWLFLNPDKHTLKTTSASNTTASKATPPSQPQPSPAAAPSQQPQATAPAQAPTPSVQPVSLPTIQSTPTAQTFAATPSASAIKQRPVTAKTSASVQNTEEAAALITAQELRKRIKDQKIPAAPTMAPPADIKLSGIAWQDDHRARRAVINGFLVQEGGTVSGARITEILQDRVRFSQSGSVFELSLSASSGISAAGK